VKHWIPELHKFMADIDHIPLTESTPLNTTLEPNATDATTELTSASTDHSSNLASEAIHTDAPQSQPAVAEPEAVQSTETAPVATAVQPVPAISAAAADAEPEYDAEDFAKALESFDREQAAEKDAAQSMTAEEVVITGTVVKITDKHVVVDIGLKSDLGQLLGATTDPSELPASVRQSAQHIARDKYGSDSWTRRR